MIYNTAISCGAQHGTQLVARFCRWSGCVPGSGWMLMVRNGIPGAFVRLGVTCFVFVVVHRLCPRRLLLCRRAACQTRCFISEGDHRCINDRRQARNCLAVNGCRHYIRAVFFVLSIDTRSFCLKTLRSLSRATMRPMKNLSRYAVRGAFVHP